MKSKQDKTTMMTMPVNIEGNSRDYQLSESDSESAMSEDSCMNLVGNMRQ